MSAKSYDEFGQITIEKRVTCCELRVPRFGLCDRGCPLYITGRGIHIIRSRVHDLEFSINIERL